jgi:hypothetical protein
MIWSRRNLIISISLKFKMNIFRFIADMLHLAAILLLLYRIKKARNCIGKSTLVPSSLSSGFSDGAARWFLRVGKRREIF